jgi:hypothetical protein
MLSLLAAACRGNSENHSVFSSLVNWLPAIHQCSACFRPPQNRHKKLREIRRTPGNDRMKNQFQYTMVGTLQLGESVATLTQRLSDQHLPRTISPSAFRLAAIDTLLQIETAATSPGRMIDPVGFLEEIPVLALTHVDSSI